MLQGGSEICVPTAARRPSSTRRGAESATIALTANADRNASSGRNVFQSCISNKRSRPTRGGILASNRPNLISQHRLLIITHTENMGGGDNYHEHTANA